MKIEGFASRICNEIHQVFVGMDEGELLKLANSIVSADRIFVAGLGRSGNMMKSFAMRMMHLNVVCYVVGESTTPGIKKNDLLLIGSGSGNTPGLVPIAEKARGIGSKLGLITIDRNSLISKLADITVEVKAPSPKVDISENIHSIQPLASLFEQSLLILLDAIVLWIMAQKDISSDDMFHMHANLE